MNDGCPASMSRSLESHPVRNAAVSATRGVDEHVWRFEKEESKQAGAHLHGYSRGAATWVLEAERPRGEGLPVHERAVCTVIRLSDSREAKARASSGAIFGNVHAGLAVRLRFWMSRRTRLVVRCSEVVNCAKAVR